MNTVWMSLTIGILISLPYWLPALIVKIRMAVFTRVNGQAAIQLPNGQFDTEDFRKLYAHPAMGGRSEGAALSDLFWYWLSPGPEMHPEHLELSERYKDLSRITRKILALPKAEIETMIDAYQHDPLALAMKDNQQWAYLRLRDAFMPLWADFFYRLVFKEECSPQVRTLIVNHASDVVNALKCCKLRNMHVRGKLTNYLLEKLETTQISFDFPKDLSPLQKAHFLQGTFFNTAIVQMSEAMTHLILVIGQHPACQDRLREDEGEEYLDNVINESLRVFPLFGIAHRVVTDDIEYKQHKIEKNTVVCFNYPEYHKQGYEQADKFQPDRWQSCPVKESNFIPFGVTANRSCPAQGMAMVSMRRLTRHVIRNYYFASPVKHTRSLPSRGPCIAMRNRAFAQSFFVKTLLFPVLKLADYWEELFRSFAQLIFGTVMVLHAKKLKLCKNYFSDNNLEGSLQNSNL
ncbi:cytochrome P450 [Alteromonadaceae bacterium 2753L.S.0a.02]|nr:cytochrome P450 [Alteromonadaceae bacterium 2753L.S.0a.02]